MADTPRKWRLYTVGGVLIAGVVCALAFCYLQPFDSYLLKSWERELSTLADEDVEVRLEQIAALGERGLPTLVAALHSERQIVAQEAAVILQRELGRLELRSTDESSPIIANLARELAARSNQPGPHSDPASTRLATRLLLWPIDRKLIDGERLVADCELIIRSAKLSPREAVAEQANERSDADASFISSGNTPGVTESLTPVARSILPAPLMDAPPLPPLTTRFSTDSPAAPTTEPQQFLPVQAPRALAPPLSVSADEAATRPSTQPLDVDSQRSVDPPGDTAAAPREAAARLDFGAMGNLDVMRKLASDDESLAHEAVDELYRRGFQTKHFRLAELLVDRDPNVRLQLIRSLPQMSGIDSRPWLLWLSRDQDPVVRKAAVSVIATSADPELQRRVRELEREETDDEVLRVVRQILNTRQTTTVR